MGTSYSYRDLVTGVDPHRAGAVLGTEITDMTPDQVTLAVGGEVDVATADAMADAMDDVLDRLRPATIRVDLGGVPFMDSSGINALMVFRRRALREGCHLTVTNPQDAVRRTLEITHVAGLLGLPEGPAVRPRHAPGPRSLPAAADRHSLVEGGRRSA